MKNLPMGVANSNICVVKYVNGTGLNEFIVSSINRWRETAPAATARLARLSQLGAF